MSRQPQTSLPQWAQIGEESQELQKCTRQNHSEAGLRQPPSPILLLAAVNGSAAGRSISGNANILLQSREATIRA